MEPPLQSSSQPTIQAERRPPSGLMKVSVHGGSDTHHKPHASVFQANLVLAMTDGSGWAEANMEVLMFPTDQR